MSDNKIDDEPNPIDIIAEEIDADRIYLDDLRLDRRMNAKDYDVLMRLPLSAKQLINILYELYPPTLLADTLLADTLLAGNQQQREQQREQQRQMKPLTIETM